MSDLCRIKVINTVTVTTLQPILLAENCVTCDISRKESSIDDFIISNRNMKKNLNSCCFRIMSFNSKVMNIGLTIKYSHYLK